MFIYYEILILFSKEYFVPLRKDFWGTHWVIFTTERKIKYILKKKKKIEKHLIVGQYERFIQIVT